MNKTIEFSLSNFPSVPTALRLVPTIDAADTEFTVDLARLYHHYYTDSYGVNPPNPNHANFEYLHFLSAANDFRFLGVGPAASEGKKRNMSMDLGQAFCRYFLYEFCGITYFAHMDKVLDKPAHAAFNGITVKRISKGDAPDYLCSISPDQPFIGEAKGRFSNIAFTSAAFTEWRNQFKRIAIYDSSGSQKKLKGYIVATKFTTDTNRASNKSKVFAEDPETNGDGFLGDSSFGLGRGCIAIHYSRLLSKLGLGLLSSSLEGGFVVPEQLSFTLPVWRCNYEPLKGELFVGGFFSDTEPQMTKTSEGTVIFYPNVLKLGIPTPTFFGVSVKAMKAIRQTCLGKWELLSEIPQLEDTQYRPSNLAWLRDGSISGGLEFFELVGQETF
ncbi:hypothetical protein SAMN04488104_10851 [Algoriphagus faecimaris]|uniref:Uncharacterized protein n=1 Tax=Algoriphagus faecimaris TaxID=686796 RepID=A0A1G6Y790_9BACT|nr:hypothetical protein [Algoriphagus faecimaris]SDD86364.1 hypothetical protein SAMN04488104_10851 [Algoriphagus faecimaris]